MVAIAVAPLVAISAAALVVGDRSFVAVAVRVAGVVVDGFVAPDDYCVVD